MAPKVTPLADRFWPKVQITGFCWEWTAAKTEWGYGRIGVPGGRVLKAHRAAYEMLVGPIPAGMTLDHLCRNPPCVNPDHLEPVTMGENDRRGFGFAGRKARQTHCKRGHELAGDNLYVPPGRPTSRVCKTCHREHFAQREWRRLDPGEEFIGSCGRGHAFTPENTYVNPDRTKRDCRTCRRATEARRERGRAA